MHVADRRHGLDVVGDAARRRRRPTATLLARRPAPRRRQGRHGRLAAGRLVARRGATGRGSGGSPAACPGSAPRSSGCATTPSRRPRSPLRPAARPGPSSSIRYQDDPRDPAAGELLRARRRGELMTRRRPAPVSAAGRASAEGRRPGGRDPRPARGVRGPARAAAVAHRGAPARRPDGARSGRSPTRTSTRSPASRPTGSATSARSWRSPAS